jgi:hypothetical protein
MIKPNGSLCNDNDLPPPEEQCIEAGVCEGGACIGGGFKPPGTECDPTGEGCAVGGCDSDGVCILVDIGNCTVPPIIIFPAIPTEDDDLTTLGLVVGLSVAGLIALILIVTCLCVGLAWRSGQEYAACDQLDDGIQRMECSTVNREIVA